MYIKHKLITLSSDSYLTIQDVIQGVKNKKNVDSLFFLLVLDFEIFLGFSLF